MASDISPGRPESSSPPSTSGAKDPFETKEPSDDQKRSTPPVESGVFLVKCAKPIGGYELVERLGRGGFGEVWKATGPGGFAVALKFILQETDAGAVELRSLEAVKHIHHPHLLSMFGAWHSDGYLIIAMELADGTLLDRLQEALKQGEPGIPIGELIGQMRDAAKGIDHLNNIEIQHRDIKPANLLLVGGGVKLGDFGMAKVLEKTLASNSGAMTPHYGAPEVFNGKTSKQTDQYALAVSYCQLRGGRLPFEGNLYEVMMGHSRRPPDLTMVPQGERPVVARALAKKAEERWPNCQAFVRALANHLSGRHRPAEPRLQPAPPPPRQPRKEPRPPAKPRTWPTPQMAVGLGFALIGLLVLVVSLFNKLKDRTEGSERAQVQPPAIQQEPKTTEKVAEAAQSKPQERVPANGSKASGKPSGNVDPPAAREQPQKPPVESPVEITNSIGMKLVMIPAGKFMMGSPKEEEGRYEDEQQHEVEITRPFYLAKYETTVGQFRAFVRDTGYKTEAEKDGEGGWGYNSGGGTFEGGKPQYHWQNVGWEQTDQHPVVNVSWDDALAFCQWLNKKEGKEYRLPTEAQWEYSCRARTTTRFHGGEDEESLQRSANIADASFKQKYAAGSWAKSWDDGYPFTAPVGRFKPNAFGLYDMHGNVWEWCQDWYDKDYYNGSPRQDPQGAGAGAYRVIRGGSFSLEPRSCRSATRTGYLPSNRYVYFGFRVLLVP